MNITIKKAWGKMRQDRWGVVVELIDGKGNKFDYMPTYPDLEEINKLLVECEKLNEDKHK